MDRQIAGDNPQKHKYKYPPKIDKWMTFQSRKADSEVATVHDNEELIYQVNEPGGTTADGVQYGGQAFKVSLRNCECTCTRPSLVHLACSHLLTAARMRHVDYNHPLTVRESPSSPSQRPKRHGLLDLTHTLTNHSGRSIMESNYGSICHGRLLNMEDI
jgi:hypothetical protein